MSESFFDSEVFEGKNYSNHPLPTGIYEDCRFINCRFSESTLAGISFVSCTFEGCDLSSAKLNGTVLQEIRFINCKLVGLHFEDCKNLLFAVSFLSCNMDLVSFYGMLLKNCSFASCRMHEADFSNADLSGLVLDRCDLEDAIFDETRLEGSDFRTADAYTIDPARNRVRGAKFSFPGVTGLLQHFGIIIE